MNANESGRMQPRTTTPLGPQDLAFLDYLIAKAIEACASQPQGNRPRNHERPCG